MEKIKFHVRITVRDSVRVKIIENFMEFVTVKPNAYSNSNLNTKPNPYLGCIA
jgi:hypothetical protein